MNGFQGIATISYWEQNNGKISISISNAYIASGGNNKLEMSNTNRHRPASKEVSEFAISLVFGKLNPFHNKLSQRGIDRIPKIQRKPIIKKMRAVIEQMEEEILQFAYSTQSKGK